MTPQSIDTMTREEALTALLAIRKHIDIIVATIIDSGQETFSKDAIKNELNRT